MRANTNLISKLMILSLFLVKSFQACSQASIMCSKDSKVRLAKYLSFITCHIFSFELSSGEYGGNGNKVILVGIFMGVETFVFNKGVDIFRDVVPSKFNSELTFSIINLAKNSPIIYASISVGFVVFIGFIFSYIRELIHHFRYPKKN